MGKVLIAYFSLSGNTKKMAEYIAEGVRFSGQQAEIEKISDIKNFNDLNGYDGCIFGSPTYSLNVPEPVKAFFLMAEKAGIEGKLGGAFGSYKHDVSYKHDAYAPAIIFDSLQRVCKMEPFELGPFNLKEEVVETSEGMKACQDYGRVFGEKLGS
ncbi:flavodoxin family protein [Chloroflexota bacterium]